MRRFKQVCLRVQNGLCNRLLLLTKAQTVCERLGLPLSIDWQSNVACPAEFVDLFEVPNNLILEPLHLTKETIPPFDHFLSDLPHGMTECLLEALYEASSPDVEFKCECVNHMRQLKPVDYIQKQIVAIKNSWPEKIVGVHVRRTDHERQTNNGRFFSKYLPTDLAICSLIDNINSDTHLFVASDNLYSLDMLIKRYGQRVHYYEKVWKEEALRQTSMADAVIDLYLLSNTNSMIGTFYSTFSSYAADLGGIPIVCENVGIENRKETNQQRENVSRRIPWI